MLAALVALCSVKRVVIFVMASRAAPLLLFCAVWRVLSCGSI